MAKQTKQKTLVEKVIEGADKILHPENHEPEEQADQDETSEPAFEIQRKPKSAYKSEMGKHKKFDKFK